MASSPPTSQTDLAGRQASEARVEHALALLLADQHEAALQWAAAVVESDPGLASALVVTSRLLEQLGRTRAAVDGLWRAVDRAIDAGDLPLALAAVGDLRGLGVDVGDALDRVARSFARGSSRLNGAPPAAYPQIDDFQPLSPFLTGPALASKATQILHEASRVDDPPEGPPEPALVAPLPLFSSLPADSLRELLSAFDTITVPAGHCVVREGEEGAAAYIVACGELEVSRAGAEGKPPIALARLGPGSFFGEMELLAEMPRTASLTATRPSILLVATRESLDAIAARRPEVAAELTAHCRRRIVANLGRGSPLLRDVPVHVRARLLERFEARLFRKGDKLVREGEEPQGLYLVVSGEVVVVAREGGEAVLLATLATGETVGEVELILCRIAEADAIAAHPTATWFLPRREFFALVQEHPALLPGMYLAAVRRHSETKLALEAASVVVTDGCVLEEATPVPKRVAPAATTTAQHWSSGRRVTPASPEPPSPEEATPVGSTTSQPIVPGRPGTPQPSTVPPTSSTVRPPAAEARSATWLATRAALVAAAVAVLAVAAIGTFTRITQGTGDDRAGAAHPADPAPSVVATALSEPAVVPSSTAATAAPLGASSPRFLPARPTALGTQSAVPSRLAAPLIPAPAPRPSTVASEAVASGSASASSDSAALACDASPSLGAAGASASPACDASPLPGVAASVAPSAAQRPALDDFGGRN